MHRMQCQHRRELHKATTRCTTFPYLGVTIYLIVRGDGSDQINCTGKLEIERRCIIVLYDMISKKTTLQAVELIRMLSQRVTNRFDYVQPLI